MNWMHRVAGVALVGSSVVALGVHPSGADVPTTYTVPASVQVLQIVAAGGRGGDTWTTGGGGCKISVSLSVSAGDVFSWSIGGNGGDGVYNESGAQSGGAGGVGTYPGGNGGDTVGPATAGAGGGAATTVSKNSTEIIVAAGGGGATGNAGGGGGCPGGPAGSNGFGSYDGTWSATLAGGATTSSAGGAGAVATGANAGGNGNSASDTPAGKGGNGSNAVYSGNGGGGGGGGVSGGGGGFGQISTYAPGSANSGAAGLSLAPTAGAGIVDTAFASNIDPLTYGGLSGGVTVNVVSIVLNYPLARTGSSYTGSVTATFGGSEAVTGENARYSVSPPLPAGLTLDPATGSITGRPTEAVPTTEYTLTVSRVVPPPPPPCEVCGGSFGVGPKTDPDTRPIVATSTATFTLGGATLPPTGLSNDGRTFTLVGLLLVAVGVALVAVRDRRRRPSISR